MRAYQTVLHQGPPALRAFLDQFPKGADLHVHLSGAVYAETFIREAGEDGLCVDSSALRFAKPPCAPPLVPHRPPGVEASEQRSQPVQRLLALLRAGRLSR